MKTIKHNNKAQSDNVTQWQYTQELKQAKKQAKQARLQRKNKHFIFSV